MATAGRREPVVFELAVLAGGLLPLRGDEAVALQAVQGGVERAVVDDERVAGRLPDGRRDAVAVRRPEQQRFENQHVERALQQLDAIGRRHGVVSAELAPEWPRQEQSK